MRGDRERVWPPELEAALLEGLEEYSPDDQSRRTRSVGRFPVRSKFLSDYVFKKTGQRRTPRQVGELLQGGGGGGASFSGLAGADAASPGVIIQHEERPDDETIEAAAQLYIDLSKDEPTFLGAVAGRLDLAEVMARGVIRPLALVSGELYTARNEDDELVGFAAWAPPGRSSFDTPEQLDMGFNDFLNAVDEEGRAFQAQILGETVPKFVDSTLGIDNAEVNCYFCWFAMVRRDYQRMGICRALFDLVYEKAKATGATMALLTASRENVVTYEKLGFKERGHQKFESPWAEWTFYSMSRDTSKD